MKNEEKEEKEEEISSGIVFLIPLLVTVASFCFGYHSVSSQVASPETERQWTYRDACLSGKFTNVKDLHQFVTEKVEEVKGELDKDSFLSNHLARERPVLMKGAAVNWTAYRGWSDEYLEREFHSVKFYVDLRKHHSTDLAVRRKMTLARFLQQYKKRDWYLDSMTYDTGFMDETNVPAYLNISGLFNDEGTENFYHNFYLSSGNTSSPLHYDGYGNFLTVLDGTKEWIIAEPGEMLKLQYDQFVDHPNLSPINVTNFNASNHPGLCDVRWKRAVVEAGDTLFVPLLHSHHVYSPPGRNMALGMWFTLPAYDRLLDSLGWDDTTMPPETLLTTLEEHVASRPAPCEVTTCAPVPSHHVTLRTLLTGVSEQYSRDSDIPTPAWYRLSTGQKIPAIGYGTGAPQGSIDHPFLNSREALNRGYKLIDTAALYGNEGEVGRAVRESKWSRSAVFLVDKILASEIVRDGEKIEQRAHEAIRGCLERLGLAHIDLLLIHDTFELSDNLEALTVIWRVMEEFVREGSVLSLGLSHAEMVTLNHLESIATIPVCAVQNLFNPVDYDVAVYKHCRSKNIAIMGFGITGDYHVSEGLPNPILDSVLLSSLASLYFTSQHLILYNWAAQMGVIPIVRTRRVSHMRENLEFRDVFLNPRHIALLNELMMVP